MSKVRKVISSKNRKPYLPVSQSMLIYLILDRFNPPGWVWGVMGTLVGIVWLGMLYLIFKYDYEEVDIFKNKAE